VRSCPRLREVEARIGVTTVALKTPAHEAAVRSVIRRSRAPSTETDETSGCTMRQVEITAMVG
jgi:hypothetical protein